MRWIRRMLLVAACLGLGIAFGELRPSAAETGPAQIRVTARQVMSTSLDFGRRGAGAGDVQISAAQVYNIRVTPRPIGSYELVCTTVRTVSRNCQATLVLPRGSVVLNGTIRYRPFYQLAVVGGTGLYDNARGTLTVTRSGTRPVREILVVRLVG